MQTLFQIKYKNSGTIKKELSTLEYCLFITGANFTHKF